MNLGQVVAPLTNLELKKEVIKRVTIGEEYQIGYRSCSDERKHVKRNEKSRLVALIHIICDLLIRKILAHV